MFSRKQMAAFAAAAGMLGAGAVAADSGDRERGCEHASAGESRHGHGMERMKGMQARMGSMHGRQGANAPEQSKEKAEEHKH